MELLTYRRFPDREQAEALAGVLSKHKIEFELKEYHQSLDGVYIGTNPFDAKFHINIKGDDFQKADAVLLKEGDQTLEQVGSDHYLFQFTDQELYDVVSKPDEWNELDYKLAAKILRERGRDVSDATIEKLKEERIKTLAKPESGGAVWIIIGYLSAFIGGALGIFIGWHLSSFKKTLPDGRRVKAYTPSARQHGSIILMIGIVAFIVWMSLAILKA